jgi:hypothetical protein
MSELLNEIMKRAAELGLRTGPIPVRLEVGSQVVAVLRATIPPAPSFLSPVASLTGLPVVETDGLAPLAWRAVDADDNVIKSGELGS